MVDEFEISSENSIFEMSTSKLVSGIYYYSLCTKSGANLLSKTMVVIK